MSYPFPIEHYDQVLTDWIKPGSVSDKPLLSPALQQAQFEHFKERLMYPWSEQNVIQIKTFDLKADEEAQLVEYGKNIGRMSCDAASPNFNVPYPAAWIENLRAQVNLSQFEGKNSTQGKGIALDNLPMRILPTEDRYFHDCNLPGEGDSFDYLQMTALWAGTPVYILGESVDHNWYLVRSSDAMAWVKSAGIKKVSDDFVTAWSKAASQSLVAINGPINTETLFIFDETTHSKLFSGFIGAVFPVDRFSKPIQTYQ